MLNAISTLAMSGFLAITGGTMNINNSTTADLITPNAIVFQVADEAGTDDDNSEVREFFQTERAESAAEILGLTVAELEEAREAGTTMEELLEDAGLTGDEFRELMATAREESVTEAIDSGLITQEEADAFAERQENGRGDRDNRGNGQNSDAVAEILGLTVEELEAAREDGTTIEELVEAAGLTEDEFRDAIGAAREEARETRVEEALENGEITEEEAAEILSGEGRGQGGRGEQGDRGQGARGEQGGRGQRGGGN